MYGYACLHGSNDAYFKLKQCVTHILLNTVQCAFNSSAVFAGSPPLASPFSECGCAKCAKLRYELYSTVDVSKSLTRR